MLWPYRTPGIPDPLFEQLPGIPLTARELRVLILSQLQLAEQGCLWDIGAGTGTILIEAALLCPQQRLIAIERDGEVVELIQRNCQRFGINSIEIIQGTAPACLATIQPRPQRILLEGGSPLTPIFQAAWELLLPGGRLVATAGSLESLYILSEGLAKAQARHVEVIQAGLNRLQKRGLGQAFLALDPLFILSGEKPS
ncbi:MAG: precorrin-6Y C5,15-methyltransferase subunit CbiT [Thermostichales cyanobacterium SZTDM-1c_bins_54]